MIFDFYFADVSEAARDAQPGRASTSASGSRTRTRRICESVQRGPALARLPRGRLSVRREAGEHLFHRLLAADLKAGLSTA